MLLENEQNKTHLRPEIILAFSKQLFTITENIRNSCQYQR